MAYYGRWGKGKYRAPTKAYVDHESISGTTCVYCGLPGTTRDHIPAIARAYETPDVPHICVRACERCNQLLGDKGGLSVEERQSFIRHKLGLSPG